MAPRCLKPRATSLAFARTTSPRSLEIQGNTHFAEMTLSLPGCYVDPSVPASASPWYSLSITCLQMAEYSYAHRFSIRVRRRTLACLACEKEGMLARWGLVENILPIPSRAAINDSRPCPTASRFPRSVPPCPPPQQIAILQVSPSLPPGPTTLHIVTTLLVPCSLPPGPSPQHTNTTLLESCSLPPGPPPQHFAILRVRDVRPQFPGSTLRNMWLR